MCVLVPRLCTIKYYALGKDWDLVTEYASLPLNLSFTKWQLSNLAQLPLYFNVHQASSFPLIGTSVLDTTMAH